MENETRRDLIKRTARFAKEDTATTWRLLAISLLVFALGEAATALAPWWPLKLVFSVFLGLVWVRLFIFVHDWLHGAIFRESKAGAAVMSFIAHQTLTPPSVWEETHDYHHKNNAKMVGASIGSYPLVTVGIYRTLTPMQKRMYAFARHPLTILFGYFTVFIAGMCLSAFRRAPRLHWGALVSLAMHFGTMGALGALFGWQVPFFGVFVPLYVATAAGGYLFYAQHNFPGIDLKGRRDWDFVHAALESSSMFDMNPLMHWLTGNIGYHHIHHLNHRIPFYNLPVAMAEIPELQAPGRTSWAPSDVWGCMRLKLWDPERRRMVTWSEAEALLEERAPAAA